MFLLGPTVSSGFTRHPYLIAYDSSQFYCFWGGRHNPSGQTTYYFLPPWHCLISGIPNEWWNETGGVLLPTFVGCVGLLTERVAKTREPETQMVNM